MNNPQNIKPGDKIRYVRMRLGETPAHYSKYIGKEFIVDGMNNDGFSVENDSNTPFFYYDEVELVVPPTSMFEFGPYNEGEKDLFLSFLTDEFKYGMCHFANNFSDLADDFLNSQPPFQGNDWYPVEYAILQKNHKQRDNLACANIYEKQIEKENHFSEKTSYGKLRRWWVYNLAVAISQQGVIAEAPKEPEFDSNIILTAKIGDKITLDGVEFTLKSMRNDKVFLESHPVDGYETVSSTYPYLHVRNSQTRVATFRRENLKELIDSKNYTIS